MDQVDFSFNYPFDYICLILESTQLKSYSIINGCGFLKLESVYAIMA